MEPLKDAELVLLLGGQRSGKSEAAEALAATGPPPVSYVATVRRTDDPVLTARVAAHRLRRPPDWETVEATDDLDLPATGTVLLDGLGMWLAGLESYPEPVDVVTRLRRGGPTIVVSEEVGLGVIPASEEGRRFADALGDLNRAVSAESDRVFLVVAGRVLRLGEP